MAIPTRTLGKNGPSVPAIGFGLMSIGGIYGAAPSDADRLALLDHAHAIGARFWDTADVYFSSEDAVGQWIRQNPEKRKDIFLATKFGLQMDPATGAQTVTSDPEYVKKSCEKSLQRLGTDYIDLYYCHRVDKKTPIEKTVQAMVELKNQGKIRCIGLSEVSASTLRRAHAVHPISALQVEYSPFALDIEDPKAGVLQTARELGITIVAYSPMGRGMLTGRFQSYEDVAKDPFLHLLPRYSKENFPKILALIEKIKKMAVQKGCTVGQLTMAWVLNRGDDIIPIPGTRSIKYLDENFATLQVKLTEEEYKELTEAVMATTLDGARYPAGFPDNYELGETPPL